MSPRPELAAVAADIANHLERVAAEAAAVERLGALPDRGETTLWALAGHLHSFYTGCEYALTRAIERLDGVPPSAPDSHARLLQIAALDVPTLRPPVIRAETARALGTYRKFRHFFRNAYGVTLIWERMAAKVREIRPTHEQFAADVEAFRAFLTAAANA